MSVYVARQPILDAKLQTVGFELLFRSGPENIFNHPDGNQASLAVMGTSLCHIGLEKLTDGKPAWINFTRDLLLKGYPRALPKERVVLEILEGVKPEDELLQACAELKKEGYRLALDDVLDRESFQPFADLVDIIKVDFLRTRGEERRRLAEACLRPGLTLLAEKVETHTDCQEALAAGFTLLQGFFFSKPKILSAKRMPSRRSTEFFLLQEAFRPAFDLDRIELVVKQNPTLSFKLLQYVNSAYFSLRSRIQTIRQALVLLGQKQFRRWVVIIVASGFSRAKPALLTQAVVRARFCENLAGICGLGPEAEELFLTGLFSLMDAILDLPPEQILADVPVAPAVQAAILGQESPYRDPLELGKAYEKGDWEKVARFLADHELAENRLPFCYEEAVSWAQELVLISSADPATPAPT